MNDRLVSAGRLLTSVCLVAIATIFTTSCKDGESEDDAAETIDCSTASTRVEKVMCAIENLKAGLSSSQIDVLQYEFTEDNANNWSNLPCGSQCRNGLQFNTLSDAQIELAKAVVEAAMGTTENEGFDEAMQISAADDVLGDASSGNMYSSGIYFISILGTPSTTGTWMLQYGGHHLAVNTTYNANTVQGATPLFEGVEPKSWTSGGITYSPLSQEQAAMAAMLAGLSSSELASAKLTTTFSDVVLGPGEDGQFPSTKIGLPVSGLSAEKKALVLNAMKPWVNDSDDETAAALLATYESELDETYIAFSGNASLSNNADYVRIDGPNIWIEFVCQSGVVMTGIHYHSIWRDHSFDYGGNF